MDSDTLSVIISLILCFIFLKVFWAGTGRNPFNILRNPKSTPDEIKQALDNIVDYFEKSNNDSERYRIELELLLIQYSNYTSMFNWLFNWRMHEDFKIRYLFMMSCAISGIMLISGGGIASLVFSVLLVDYSLYLIHEYSFIFTRNEDFQKELKNLMNKYNIKR